VLRRVNEGDLLGAAAALETWRRAEFEGEVIVIDALIRRRAAEKTLFLTPVRRASSPLPPPLLRPQLDFGAPAVQPPAGRASEIVTPLDGDTAAPERTAAPVAPFAVDEPSPAQAAAAAVVQAAAGAVRRRTAGGSRGGRRTARRSRRSIRRSAPSRRRPARRAGRG
jgi:lysozyme